MDSATQPAALLEEAGYTKGADGVYAKDGRPLSLRISTTAGNQLRETPGETLSRAGGWLGDLPGASRMVAAPAP
jgi:hypothetical protein